MQNFSNGNQNYNHTSNKNRARAVRRSIRCGSFFHRNAGRRPRLPAQQATTPAAIAWERDQAVNLSSSTPSSSRAATRPGRRSASSSPGRSRARSGRPAIAIAWCTTLLHRRIGPRFERAFIADSCACLEGRGTLYAGRRLEAKVRAITANWTRPAWYLKCDVASFFPSIDKRILGALLERRIHEPFWRALALQVLFHDPRPGADVRGDPAKLALIPPEKSLFNRPAHLGLPIGNLSSQFGANVYLNELDQLVKHRLGVRHYIRYVDDFVLLHESPQQLNAWRAAIEAFLAARLGLKLAAAKTVLQPIERGIDFAGHVIKPHRRTLRRRTLNGALRRLEACRAPSVYAAANSYLGLARQATHSHTDRARICNVVRRRGFLPSITTSRRHTHEKLLEKRLAGYYGWNNDCTIEHLEDLLRKHIEKPWTDRNIVDMANFCMMLWNRKHPNGRADDAVKEKP
jgi:RNA-directed DNA polymerase